MRIGGDRYLSATYDKLVSIEMIEAIGHQYFDTYFAQCGRLLRPHGAMLLQAITIADQRYDDAFIRMWEFYFCYCEGGFAERVIGDVQMLLVKPGNRRTPIANL